VVDSEESGGPIPAAQDALVKAATAAGIAAVAAAIGLAALVVGMIAVIMATIAIASRIIGEMLSHLAELIHGMIDAVVAMVPALLRGAISIVALVCMWFGFQFAWTGYAQDMPSWLAAILAATIAVVPVAYGFYRHLWPWVLAMSLAVLGVGWVLANAGTLVRVGAVLGVTGAVVWRDVMHRRQGEQDHGV
jgi:hypothetical protein